MSISYHFLSREEFFPFFNENRAILFKTNFDFNILQLYSEEERTKIKELQKSLQNMKDYQLVAKDGEKIVGWSFGEQKSPVDFYMINSAVFPDYRRRGIYTELMRRAVEHLKDMGFQHIYSKHKMGNNDIIIPKLKFGFVITGMEVNDMFGNLVQLSYYTNPRRRELLDIRTGMRKPSEEDMGLIY